MSSFEDAIWTHLVEHHGADRFEFSVPTAPKHRVRPLAVTAGVAVVLAAAVVAYALTRVSAGSYTISLNDISTGIPELNAKFAQLGIRETVVPIKAGCTASSFDPAQAGAGSMTQTVTVNNQSIPAGTRGFIAAEQLPNGRVGLAHGDTSQPIPSCFPTTTSSGIPGP